MKEYCQIAMYTKYDSSTNCSEVKELSSMNLKGDLKDAYNKIVDGIQLFMNELGDNMSPNLDFLKGTLEFNISSIGSEKGKTELEKRLRIFENFPKAGDCLEVDDVLDLIHVGKEIVAKGNGNLYLTECVRCCSNEASYRLFDEIPKFNGGTHPDTGINGDSMILKCYDEPAGLAENVSRMISKDSKKVNYPKLASSESIVYMIR